MIENNKPLLKFVLSTGGRLRIDWYEYYKNPLFIISTTLNHFDGEESVRRINGKIQLKLIHLSLQK